MRIVCTDKQTHPSRELAVLDIVDDPERYDAMRADGLDSEPHEVEWVIRGDQVSYHLDRAATRGDTVHMTVPEVGMTEVGDGAVGPPGDGRGALWRFHCPTCRRDVPLRGDTLHRILTATADAGRASIDLSALPASLS